MSYAKGASNSQVFNFAGFSLTARSYDDELYAYLDRMLDRFKGGEGKDMDFMLGVDWMNMPSDSDCPDGLTHISLPTGLELAICEEYSDDCCITAAVPGIEEGQRRKIADDFIYPFLKSEMLQVFLSRLNERGDLHSLMVHSCGAVNEGNAYLFAGLSGSGKSTVGMALTQAGKEILGDELVILTEADHGWLAHGTPLEGDMQNAEVSPLQAPLRAIFFLGQGDETELARLDTSHAISSLISVIVPSRRSSDRRERSLMDYEGETLALLLEEASTLADDIPCYALQLTLGAQPWEEIFNQAQKGA